MEIVSLKFISKSSIGILYDVEYKTKGNCFNRSKLKHITIFLESKGNSGFWPIVTNYNTGETIHYGKYIYNAIVHHYELNHNQ